MNKIANIKKRIYDLTKSREKLRSVENRLFKSAEESISELEWLAALADSPQLKTDEKKDDSGNDSKGLFSRGADAVAEAGSATADALSRARSAVADAASGAYGAAKDTVGEWFPPPLSPEEAVTVVSTNLPAGGADISKGQPWWGATGNTISEWSGLGALGYYGLNAAYDTIAKPLFYKAGPAAAPGPKIDKKFGLVGTSGSGAATGTDEAVFKAYEDALRANWFRRLISPTTRARSDAARAYVALSQLGNSVRETGAPLGTLSGEATKSTARGEAVRDAVDFATTPATMSELASMITDGNRARANWRILDSTPSAAHGTGVATRRHNAGRSIRRATKAQGKVYRGQKTQPVNLQGQTTQRPNPAAGKSWYGRKFTRAHQNGTAAQRYAGGLVTLLPYILTMGGDAPQTLESATATPYTVPVEKQDNKPKSTKDSK